MKFTFYGAAGEVTGSQHLLEVNDYRILFDCGLFQGRRAEARLKNEQIHCSPESLDAVILSHAHIDHCGNLPRLFRKSFRGRIFCTRATADVAEVMLRDAAKIQVEDVRYLAKHVDLSTPVEPLYTQEDVDGLLDLFEPLDFDERYEWTNDLRICFRQAGHILGSAITELDVEEKGDWKRIVYTGDLGQRGLPLLKDPAPTERCDVLICESTYGNRVHRPATDIKSELQRILREAVVLGGRVIVPAFSLGRTQHLVYFLNELFNSGELPLLPVYVDSPLANRITRVYRDHLDIMDRDVQNVLRNDPDPFGFPWLTYISSSQESRTLNDKSGPLMIISASGMCESGRIVHHLMHSVGRPENTIVMIGFQAAHTNGRRLIERQPSIRFFGKNFSVQAKVEQLDGLSAHADAEDFKWWFEQISSAGGIGQAFLVHGEAEGAQALAGIIDEYCDEPPLIPQRGDSFEV